MVPTVAVIILFMRAWAWTSILVTVPISVVMLDTPVVAVPAGGDIAAAVTARRLRTQLTYMVRPADMALPQVAAEALVILLVKAEEAAHAVVCAGKQTKAAKAAHINAMLVFQTMPAVEAAQNGNAAHVANAKALPVVALAVSGLKATADGAAMIIIPVLADVWIGIVLDFIAVTTHRVICILHQAENQ